MPDQTVYRCRAGHTESGTHGHSRRVGSDTDWAATGTGAQDTGLYTSTTPGGPPAGFERHCAPDGTLYLFSTLTYTASRQPGESSPEEQADLTQTPPPREVRTGGEEVIHLTTQQDGMHVDSVCGRRVRYVSSHPREWTGQRRVTLTECPECFSLPGDGLTVCDIPRHRTAPEPHYHLRSVMSGETQWHSTPGWGAAHPTLYVDIPGTFTNRRPETRDTTPERGTTMTFTPGDIVTAIASRPSQTTADHLFVIASPTDSVSGEAMYTTVASTDHSIGWLPNGRTDADERVRRAIEGTGCWNFRESNLRLATPEQQDMLSPEMELVRRRVQVAMLGAEPVLLCTHEEHRSRVHRHSRHRDGHTIMQRDPDLNSEHTPLPGLWAKGTAVNPVLSLGTLTHREVRDNANTTIHRTASDAERRVPTVCGQTIYSPVAYSAREWRGIGGTTLAECTTCFAEVAEVAETVELHPIDADKLRRHPAFTLHSKPGQVVGNDLVFGCQRFPMATVAAANGTIEFQPGGAVVTMPATARGSRVFVGDRELGMGDVNEYTTSITADPSAAPPVPLTNAVVMEEGYYGCDVHPNEILHLLAGSVGGPRLHRVTFGTGNRPTGTIGQRTGLRGTLSNHRPVKGSTTAQIMEITTQPNYCLVPIDEVQRPYFEQHGYTFGTLPEHTSHIIRCNADGSLLAEPF